MYTIMSAIWSVMKEKHLAKSLWNEIANAVVYVKNRCPSTEGKTLFEKCNEEAPDVSNLRVLGCRAWVQVPNTTLRTPSHSRSWQGIMVGYEGPNQCRIYNLLTKKVHILRDVNFDEGFVYDPSLNGVDQEETFGIPKMISS